MSNKKDTRLIWVNTQSRNWECKDNCLILILFDSVITTFEDNMDPGEACVFVLNLPPTDKVIWRWGLIQQTGEAADQTRNPYA